MNHTLAAVVLFALVPFGPGCSAGEPTAASELELQMKLPSPLREVSGLALTPRGTLLAVADEEALVFEIDLAQRTATRWLAIGDPPLDGDFEGIEFEGDRVWLVESNGTLLWSDGKEYERIETGLDDRCEIEGLVHDTRDDCLLLLCKTPRQRKDRDTMFLYAVDLQSGARKPEADLSFDLKPALKRLNEKRLNPSGVTFAANGQDLIIIAAKQKAFFVYDREGTLTHADRLPRVGKHRQAEGIAQLADGRIAIADEGGSKAGRLSIYGRIYE